MWKPPERIRHRLPTMRSPALDEAQSSLWFSPIRYRALHLTERTWVPAMVPWRATDEGFVTQDVIDWYRRFAEGKPGALVVEATGIRDVPSGPLLRIGHDRFLPGLQDLVTAVHEASEGRTRLYIQLIDFLTIRRRPEPEKYFSRFLQITDSHRRATGESGDEDVRAVLLDLNSSGDRQALESILSPRELESLDQGFRERVTDLDQPHIRDLPQVLPALFADAADRARRAGFDGVELHYAHAYTMASFLSALNDRDDGYGGAREDRVRLPLEVYQRVRERVGKDFTVGCRFLTEDCLEGGSTLEDSRYFGRRFAQAGMDFLSLSRGGKFEDAKQPKVGRAAYPYTGPSGYECMPVVISDEQGPFGRNVEPSRLIRQSIREAGLETPVVVSGGISTFEQAEEILRSGDADIVASARQTLADPDWFLKIRGGFGDQVRRCIFTNYCEGLDQMHKQVTCQLWDREELDEPGITLAKETRRRLIAPKWRPEES